MNVPTDPQLYEDVKATVYQKMPIHSAYRSGHVVRLYKTRFKEIHGRKSPYKFNSSIKNTKKTKSTKKTLKRWFAEKWVNQRGEVGYRYKNDIYRPSVRITQETPQTHGELTRRQIKRARYEKWKNGRVVRFDKTRKNPKSKTDHSS